MKRIDIIMIMRYSLEVAMFSVGIVAISLMENDKWLLESIMILVIMILAILVALYEQSQLAKHWENDTISEEQFNKAKDMLLNSGDYTGNKSKEG